MLAETVTANDPVTTSAPAKETAPAEAKAGETTIVAPMPGLIIRYDVKIGDEVKAGDNIAVLEAMKMAIDLPTPVGGRVKAISFKAGDHVARDDVLAIIG